MALRKQKEKGEKKYALKANMRISLCIHALKQKKHANLGSQTWKKCVKHLLHKLAWEAAAANFNAFSR